MYDLNSLIQLGYNPSMESVEYKPGYKPVFILLMHSHSRFANIIKIATRADYSHSCISFNSDLNPCYTFGRKHSNGPVSDKGFSIESYKEILAFQEITGKKIQYALYVTFCDPKKFKLIQKRLQFYIDNKDTLRYSTSGCVKNFFGVKSERNDEFFCSGFVADLLLTAGKNVLDKNSYSLVKPIDLGNMDNIIFISSGNLEDYDKKDTDVVLKEFIREHKK